MKEQLIKIEIENFKGFNKHSIKFNKNNIIVGQNNAGKSTLVEAISILSRCLRRVKNKSFSKSPFWLNEPLGPYGVKIEMKDFELDIDNLFYAYNDPPSIIKAYFSSGLAFYIAIKSKKEIFIVIVNKGVIIKTRTQLKEIIVPTISILPQVGPIQEEEYRLRYQYVNAWRFTKRSSLHFRNHLLNDNESFKEFKEMTEKNWPEIDIYELEDVDYESKSPIKLLIRNREYVGELYHMGHGLQIWLQILWFLIKSKDSDLIILDEPDVYLHSDLQNKLLSVLSKRNIQFLITTHSIELISLSNSSDILIINRYEKESKYADEIVEVQSIIEGLGSIQNIHLAKLYDARLLLLVENHDDIKLLHGFQRILYETDFMNNIPYICMHGWTGWKYHSENSIPKSNGKGESLKVAAIFDSDFKTEEEIEERVQEGNKLGIKVIIWKRKEIESYLYNKHCIARIICNEKGIDSLKDLENFERWYINENKTNVIDNMANEIFLRERGKGLQNANRKARERYNFKKDIFPSEIYILLGKDFMKSIYNYVKSEFQVSLSNSKILENIKQEEISEEIKKLIFDIHSIYR